MAKYGSYIPAKGQYPCEQVEADYMFHKEEYVQLFKKARNHDDDDELVAVFRLEKGWNVRKGE